MKRCVLQSLRMHLQRDIFMIGRQPSWVCTFGRCKDAAANYEELKRLSMKMHSKQVGDPTKYIKGTSSVRNM